MAKLLVAGGASLDTLHLDGETHASAGGAGMYTAMAAVRCGVEASMFAPRPEPLPEVLCEVNKRLTSWIGPVVKPEELPHFEIEHRGDKAHYLNTFTGAESRLDPLKLPSDIAGYALVHFTPLGDSDLQLKFIEASRRLGARMVSAGTYLCMINGKRQSVLKSMEMADVFFMNEEEASLIFGSLEEIRVRAGKILYVTMGSKGCLVVQGDLKTQLKAVSVKVKDPTGAGDTFCGATLAGLILGEHPVMAAHRGMALAAEEIGMVGPLALFSNDPAPAPRVSNSVRINQDQVIKVSELVKQSSAASPSAFTGKDFPSAYHPKALDYFFATILQQFSFWEERDGHYDKPLVATIDGDSLKGSAYCFRSFVKLLETDPEFYKPERQAALTRKDMLVVFKSDDGNDPMPAVDLHCDMARRYGMDMTAAGKTPAGILEAARASSTPLKTFLSELDKIGGYKEDPLRKKSNLLALVLNQRPEVYLSFGEGEEVQPVIDYHTMRGCLRMGLVELVDEKLRQIIEDRAIVTEEEEWAIRYACYLAVQEVVKYSDKSMGAVDWFFFYYSRQRCPEMTEPVCAECAVDAICAHRKELFQPVIRTTYY